MSRVASRILDLVDRVASNEALILAYREIVERQQKQVADAEAAAKKAQEANEKTLEIIKVYQDAESKHHCTTMALHRQLDNMSVPRVDTSNNILTIEQRLEYAKEECENQRADIDNDEAMLYQISTSLGFESTALINQILTAIDKLKAKQPKIGRPRKVRR